MKDDKSINPTNISPLCTVAVMICADYFPDMLIIFDPFICGQLLTFHATELSYYAKNEYYILTFIITCFTFTLMPLLAVECYVLCTLKIFCLHQIVHIYSSNGQLAKAMRIDNT